MKRISLILDANGDCALPSRLNPIRVSMVSVNAIIQGSTQLAAVLTNGAGVVVAEFNTLSAQPTSGFFNLAVNQPLRSSGVNGNVGFLPPDLVVYPQDGFAFNMSPAPDSGEVVVSYEELIDTEA